MANFSVPTYSGIAQAGQQYSDMLMKVAMIRREEKLREEENRTQALLGVSQGDFATLAPEARQEIANAKDSRERADVLAKWAQIVQARKNTQGDLISQAANVGSAVGTGQDPSAMVAEHQNALVTSGLPPEIIAQEQTRLGIAANAGSTKRAGTLEVRGARRAEVEEGRRYEEGEYAKRTAAAESRQLAAEARQSQREIEREARALVASRANRYDIYRMKLGLPEGTPRDIIDGANTRALLNEARMTPQEMSANTAVSTFLTQKANEKKRTGKFEDIVGLAYDSVQLAGSNGSGMVPVPVVSNDGWFSTEWRVEMKHPAQAQGALGDLQARAFEFDSTTGQYTTAVKDEKAARLFNAYAEMAASGKNRWLANVAAPLDPETKAKLDKAAAEEAAADAAAAATPEVPGATGKPKGPREVGASLVRGAKGIDQTLRDIGMPTFKNIVPSANKAVGASADVALRAGTYVGEVLSGAISEAFPNMKPEVAEKLSSMISPLVSEREAQAIADSGEAAKRTIARSLRDFESASVEKSKTAAKALNNALKTVLPNDRAKELTEQINEEFKRRVSSRNK